MRTFLAVLPVLAVLGTARSEASDAPARGPIPQAEIAEASRSAAPDTGRQANLPQASRQETRKGLEIKYSELERILDSLGRDSLAVQVGMRGQYRRTLREARTAKDNTRVFLDELRVSERGVTPEIWEEIRAKADLSLDSLRRLILSADSARKQHSERPDPGSK